MFFTVVSFQLRVSPCYGHIHYGTFYDLRKDFNWVWFRGKKYCTVYIFIQIFVINF